MADTMMQYQCVHKGSDFRLETVPKPTPGPTEVCIRIKAVALNALDWGMWTRGEMIHSYPATFGLDGAGIVESVGEEVTAFKPGDEVFSLCGIGGKAAAFQEIATVPQYFVSKKPESHSFEEVASLPICYLTAAAAILLGLHVPIPHISSIAPGDAQEKPRSVLVLGGGSGVGSAAIQMLRSALPDAIILTTCSSKHTERLKGLGATAIIDRNSLDIASDVAEYVSGGVDAIVDCVGAAACDGLVFNALHSNGLRLYSEVYTGNKAMPPKSVKSTTVIGRQTFKAPGGLEAMSALGKAVGDGKYKLPLPVEVIGKGWDVVGTGLKHLSRGEGVSGQKLVVTIGAYEWM